MKKVLVFVFFLVILLSAFISANAEVKEGHWVYDKDGTHKGCVSPGTDCIWACMEPIDPII
jgi:hypothetical protein